MHPILFQFGPIQIRYYGLMYVVAILIGLHLLKREVKRKSIEITEDEITNFILWIVLGGIVVARIYYVTFNWDFYSMYPKEIPAIWHGGLAIHGGLLGGIIVAYYYIKRHRLAFWKMADASAPSIILGQTLGRFGNFMNGDAHGTPTDLPWGIVFPRGSIAGDQFPGTPIHPTMLYEMTINLSIFLLLWFGLRKKKYRDGFIFATYIGLYSSGRFIVEAFRADSLMLGPIRVAQLVSLIIIAAVSLIMIKERLWKKED